MEYANYSCPMATVWLVAAVATVGMSETTGRRC